MKITQIRLTLAPSSDAPVLAYCNVSFDEQLVVHDVRLIGRGHEYLVAMPNRVRSEPCDRCLTKITVASKYCLQCGSPQSESLRHTEVSRGKFLDIAHPLTSEFRKELEQQIVERYQQATAPPSKQ